MADDEVTPFTTTTTNYGWVKPDVGASDDVWGGLLNTDLDGIDSTIKSVSNAIPAASSTTPLMDGIAAVGTGTTWARADHVHPSDVAAMNDNQIINGNFAVNQRVYVSGTALATTVYGHDRWKAGASGCTYTFAATLPDTTITITAGTLTQVIEAGNIEGRVYTLSWTGTAQARVYQGSPTGSYAASPIVTASLTAGTNTIVEFNTGTVTKVKFEVGSVATPFNRQSLAKSMADCQRYYFLNNGIFFAVYAAAGANFGQSVILPVTMRASPTIAFVGPSYSNASGIGSFIISPNSTAIYATATAANTASWQAGFTASAEL